MASKNGVIKVRKVKLGRAQPVNIGDSGLGPPGAPYCYYLYDLIYDF